METLKNSLVQSRFVYNSQRQVIAEITPAGELIHYIYATQSHSPDYIIKNGTKYKLVKDQIGSIRLVVNSSNGTIVDSTEYDEFGVKISSTSPGFISLGFAGGIEDSATGLVRFGARDYDPNLGRWTAKDPIRFAGYDSNIYNYTYSDPVNYIDPTGHFGIIGAVVGGFIGGVIGYISDGKRGMIVGATAGAFAGSGAALFVAAAKGATATAAVVAASASAGGAIGGFTGGLVGGMFTAEGPKINDGYSGAVSGAFGGLGSSVFSSAASTFGGKVCSEVAGGVAAGSTGLVTSEALR